MSTFPSQTRGYSTAGNNPVAYRLNREANRIMVFNTNTQGRVDLELKTVSEAKKIMNNPGLVCK